MSCNEEAREDTRMVWTTGSLSGDQFVPYFRLSINQVKEVRGSYSLTGRSSTVNIRVRPSVRYSNDGDNWTAAVALTFAGYDTTANSWVFVTGYTTLNPAYRFAEVGICGQNAGGVGIIEQCTVVMKLETRS